MSDEAGKVCTYDLVDTREAVTVGRRKRWPETLKRRIVAETRERGASVSVVARRHDVNANQVFKWRRQFEVGSPEDNIGLVPVTVRPPLAAAPAVGAIEIELVSGARVRVSGAIDGVVLRQVLEQLR